MSRANILEASWDALIESVTYGLIRVRHHLSQHAEQACAGRGAFGEVALSLTYSALPSGVSMRTGLGPRSGQVRGWPACRAAVSRRPDREASGCLARLVRLTHHRRR